MGEDDVGGSRKPSSEQGEQQDVAGEGATSWAEMKPGTEAGEMPAKVSDRARPMVTAGLAKQVEEVNQ
jgi:hypothetical protein